jgi:hypothetical protein
MPFDVSGNFTRSYNYVADRNAAIKIQAARVDGEFDNFATALNSVMLRNGVAPMTGALKMGGNSIGGVSAGTVGSPAISFAGDATTGIYQPSAATFAIAISGVQRLLVTATGIKVVGTAQTDKIGVGTATPRTEADFVGIASFRGAFEDVVVSALALNGTLNIDYKTAAVYMFTPNATANWTFNIRGDNVTTLDSIMAIGQMLSIAAECPQGTTAYYLTTVTIDGAAPASIKWAGATGAPTSGHVSSNDVYLIRVTKTAAGVFQVRISQSQEK